MTTMLSPDQRERFLDHFPVTDNELDKLLSLFPHFEALLSENDKHETKKEFTSSSSSAVTSIAEWSFKCADEEDTCMPSMLVNGSALSTETSRKKDQRLERLKSCERHFVPELDKILREAASSVFLVGAFATEPDETIRQQATFVEAVVSLLGRRGDRFVRSVLFSVAGVIDNGGGPPVQAKTLMNLIYRLVLARSFLESNNPQQKLSDTSSPGEIATPPSWLRSITDDKLAPSSDDDDEGYAENHTITYAMWNQWTTETAPNIHQALSTVAHYFLLGGIPSAFPLERTTSTASSAESLVSFSSEQQQEGGGLFAMRPAPMTLPLYDYAPSVFDSNDCTSDTTSSSSSLEQQLVSFEAPLAAMTLGGPWKRLYSSSANGLSFHTLQKALLGYAGPNVLIIKSREKHVFGYFTEVPWKKSPHWYTGDGDAFLFTLTPVWRRYERTYEEQTFTTSKNRQLQYLNLPNNRVGNQDLAGLAVGGVAHDAPRFHLTPSLERCTACPTDRHFTSGPLLANHTSSSSNGSDNDGDPIFFDVEELEAYAVRLDPAKANFERAVAKGQLSLDVQEAIRIQAAQVDKSQFVDDLINNADITGSKSLYAHREQSRGRASFVADDDDDGGYYIRGKEPSIRGNWPSHRELMEESSEELKDHDDNDKTKDTKKT